jgi:hypothetical protein
LALIQHLVVVYMLAHQLAMVEVDVQKLGLMELRLHVE